MGQKLNTSESESFFDNSDLDIEGITASCYCCSEHVIISLNHITTLPVTELEDGFYYAFLCAFCEEDINTLKWAEVEDISYEILWLIQEDLNLELAKIQERNEHAVEVNKADRDRILVNLYNNTLEKIKKEMSKSYLRQFVKEDEDVNS